MSNKCYWYNGCSRNFSAPFGGSPALLPPPTNQTSYDIESGPGLGWSEFAHCPIDYAASSGPYGQNGIVAQLPSTVGFQAITDGLSNTIMLGDKQLDVSAAGQYQLDDDQGYTAGWDWDTVRTANNPPAPGYPGQQRLRRELVVWFLARQRLQLRVL